MHNEKQACTLQGELTYNQEHLCLVLDNVLLHPGDLLAVEMFGHWITGQLQHDAHSWYLLTPYQTGIRLYPGLMASLERCFGVA